MHAFVVPRDGVYLSEAELISLCKQHIASYKAPKSVRVVPELPKNFQGKILKRVLRQQYASS